MSFVSVRADGGKHPAVAPNPDALFDDVVRQHRRRIVAAAFRITGNIDDAHDVAQHVFLQLYLKQPKLDDQRTIDRWLYVVTRNEALLVARRRRRDCAAEDETPPQPSPEDTVIRREQAAQVRSTIERLSADDRRVIELRHIESMPTAEMAAHLGVPVQRLKRSVERARWRLRSEMIRDGLNRDMT
jgi:RNA polymerase sigma-70 factor (ECF subfamily)